jgi:hypothetical protein
MHERLEPRLSERLDALGPSPHAELLHVLTLPDFERADRIGEFCGYPESRAFAELLIDCEEDKVFRTVLVGMLRRPRACSGEGPTFSPALADGKALPVRSAIRELVTAADIANQPETTSSALYPIQPPPIGNTLQLVLARVLEDKAAACDEVLHCARDECLPRARESGNACADVHGEAPDDLPSHLDLARMHPRSYLEAQLVNGSD